MTDYAEQIRLEQVAALATIRKVAESLPGFTFAETSGTMGAELPDTVNIEQPLTLTSAYTEVNANG